MKSKELWQSKWLARIRPLSRFSPGSEVAEGVSGGWPRLHRLRLVSCGPTRGQVETLRRLRHGSDQYVRVEHVHVNEGGQTGHRKYPHARRQACAVGWKPGDRAVRSGRKRTGKCFRYGGG